MKRKYKSLVFLVSFGFFARFAIIPFAYKPVSNRYKINSITGKNNIIFSGNLKEKKAKTIKTYFKI